MDDDFLGWFVIIIIALVGWSTISHIGATNEGQHTGYITSVEQEGLVWKTWRAYVKTDPQSSQEDAYCVTDPVMVDVLKSEEDNRDLITVSYSSPFVVFKWECGGENSIIRSAPRPGYIPAY